MPIGIPEALLVLSIVLLLIGPRRIAAMGRSLGRGIRDFKLEFSKQDEKEELSGEKEEEQSTPKR